jgi:oligopeptidase B
MKHWWIALLAAMTTPLMTQNAPVAPRKPHVHVWHGEQFSDPWFWLREKGSKPVEDYLHAENAYTESMTKDLKPFSEAIYKELLGRIKQTDLSVPTRRGKFFYYNRTVEGLQYPIRCRKAAGAGLAFDEKTPEEVLLDENELAKGRKFLSIAAFAVSDDDQRLLFSTDDTGYRQYKLFMKDLATGKVDGPLAERVRGVSWAADGNTVFYVTEDPITKRHDSLWRMQLGGKAEKIF